MVKIERDGEQYGTYCQAIPSCREGGKAKHDVVYLGQYDSAEAALASWLQAIDELERIGRPRKTEKLEAKLSKLYGLVES